MKHIIELFNHILASYTVLYLIHHMNAGDICKTIFGCTMLLMWFWIFRKEK